MGANDIAPGHVYQGTVPIANGMLQFGGSLWTICYILLARESLRTKSYGMPLLALAGNLGWELVYAIYVVEPLSEKIAFSIWLTIDIFIVYGYVKHGGNEWKHHAWVQRNLGLCLAVLTGWWALFHLAFAKWWLDNGINNKKGKWYGGVEGPDMTEMGFWVSSIPQVILSVDSLGNLLTRQHTGGASWPIWITRFFGSLIGFHGVYFWLWYEWRESHEYVMSPLGIIMWGTALAADVLYPFVFKQVRRTEKVLPDGRKVAGESIHGDKLKAL